MNEKAKADLKRKSKEFAAGTGLNLCHANRLLEFHCDEFFDMTGAPIALTFLGHEFLPIELPLEDNEGVGSTMAIDSFEKLIELQALLQKTLNCSLPANRMQEIQRAVAEGKRVSLIHILKKVNGQTGLWGYTVWEPADSLLA